jgi:hypothetical protein
MSWLRSLTDLWERQLKTAEKCKRRQFGEQADRIWGFLGKSYQQLHMSGSEDDEPRAFHDAAGPRHKVRRNLAQEYVALMMPYIFAQVPHRLASPRRPDLPPELMPLFNPMAIMKAGLPLPMAERLGAYMLTWYLNWTPSQYKLATEIRRGLPESLVKGRQVVWHALYEDGNSIMPVTQHDTVQSLVIDPDTESLREAAWIARKRRASAWRLEEIYGVDAKLMRAKFASHMAQAVWGHQEREAGRPTDPDETTGDIVEYYEVYSRIGLGMQLPSASEELLSQRDALADVQHAFLVIVPGMDYPLNLAPDKLAVESVGEEIKARLEWPIPLYENYDPWPCTVLDYFPNSENPWSTSPLKGALPLLVFLDHAWSFLLGRVRATSRDIILVASALEQEVWDAIESGVDQETVAVSLETLEDITKLIHVIQFPELRAEFFNVIELAESRFERASGMSPLMHGESNFQYRSAREAEIREGHVTSRPEDMADCVEAFMSDIAAKEAILTRMYVPPPFHLFGEPMPEGGVPDMSTPLSFFWGTIITQADPVLAAGEYDYTVEAGTARRKNRSQQFAEVQSIAQILLGPLLQVYQTTGDPAQVNNLIHMIGEPMGLSTNGLMLPQLQMQPMLPGPEQEEPQEAEVVE